MLSITLSFLLALALGEMADSLARPRRSILAGGGRALVARGAAIAWIWLLAFGLTGRPWFAAAAAVVTVGVLVAISNAKQGYLREPLLFSDIPLLESIPGNLDLFYVPDRWRPAAIAVLALLLASIAVWLAIEPAAEPAAQVAALLIVVAVTGAVLADGRLLAPVALVGTPDPQADVARIGLMACLLTYYAAWRLEPAPAARMTLPPLAASPFDAIIVVQAESFVDLRRFGRMDVALPAFDRLKQRSLCSGLLDVPSAGAYTLRPESAVLTGLGYREQGFDRFHPYLRPARFAFAALPRLFAAAGWDTLFIHPHQRRFFRRHRAMPALGFARFMDGRAFAGAKRFGPHVSDEAVGDALLQELSRRRAGDKPLFVYVVTMEAHDPYAPGRLPDEDDPVRQYIRHLENADRMLGRIADCLDRTKRRALLVAFGDHVPFLPEFADPFPDTRTDFVVAAFGRALSRATLGVAAPRPEDLHTLILNCVSAGNDAR